MYPVLLEFTFYCDVMVWTAQMINDLRDALDETADAAGAASHMTGSLWSHSVSGCIVGKKLCSQWAGQVKNMCTNLFDNDLDFNIYSGHSGLVIELEGRVWTCQMIRDMSDELEDLAQACGGQDHSRASLFSHCYYGEIWSSNWEW